MKKQKKDIGIITMHRVLNYGSYLQTYATCKFIQSCGCKATIIDYLFPNDYHKSLAAKRPKTRKQNNWIQNKIAGICFRLIHQNEGLRKEKFASFYQKELTFTKPYQSLDELQQDPPLFDIYITGSDQVWNPIWIGTDTAFLLSWAPKNRPKYSYAASFGLKELPSDISRSFKTYLERYTAISIREQSDILEKMGLPKGKVVLDPTFLLNKEEWKGVISHEPLIQGPYILCYLLDYTFNPFPYAHKVIKYIAKKTGYKVVMITSDPTNILRGYHVYPNCGPYDFLNLFYYAQFIITSSFHGTAFAINFQKSFISIVNDEQTLDNRQLAIIRELHVNPSCILKKNTPLKGFELPPPHYQLNIIENLRNMSKSYLQSMLIS